MSGDPLAGESVLAVDAPVTLRELLDKTALRTLELGAGDLGVPMAIVDNRGTVLAGAAPPTALAPPGHDAPGNDAEDAEIEGRRWAQAPLLHEGDAIGRIVVGPYPDGTSPTTARRLARHLLRVADAFLVEGLRRALSARMHMATVEEANRELTEKNRRLAQAVERLQEADRVKSNFLATVSHELRTPLTSVIGYSEMLLEGIAGDLNDEQREYVKTVMEKGDQLLSLITGVLDISRMEAGAMRFEKRPFPITEVVQIALSTIAPAARRKSIELAVSVADELPPALGDRDKVRQVLLNLLGNAVKFTPESGRIEVVAVRGRLHPELPVEADESDGLQISVRDSGIGIPPEHHKRIFDPFYQVDNSSTREFGGTGLGLHIVKRFVEGQGGSVWVESAPGGGAGFFFTLPFADAPAPAALATNEG